MIITRQTLENLNACELLLEAFCQDHPHGLDISALWGTPEEAQNFWSVVFASRWKSLIGWAIGVGLLPSRIRADLSYANLSDADLSDADLYRADLCKAKWNERTAWPAELGHDQSQPCGRGSAVSGEALTRRRNV